MTFSKVTEHNKKKPRHTALGAGLCIVIVNAVKVSVLPPFRVGRGVKVGGGTYTTRWRGRLKMIIINIFLAALGKQ